MNHSEMSQIIFCATYAVPTAQTAERMLDLLPHEKGYIGRKINAIAAGHLVALLESTCAREMQNYVDHDNELVLGSSVQCQHKAPVSAGAFITVDGWITALGDNEATFFVRASDEQEVVCEGEIRFVIEERALMERKIQRKREAIERRELFAKA